MPGTIKTRTLTRLISILCLIIVAGSMPGCSQSLKSIPEELRGKYVTNDPEYVDQFFELSSLLITLGFADGNIKRYDAKRVEKEIIDSRILYTILCANDVEGEEFNFSFFYDPADDGIIHFKNKPHVAWEKQEPKYLTKIIQVRKSGTKTILSV